VGLLGLLGLLSMMMIDINIVFGAGEVMRKNVYVVQCPGLLYHC
jgi:hypothetical protein